MSMEVFVQALVDEGVSAVALPRLLKLAREAHEKPVTPEALRKRKERALKRGNEWDQSTQSEIVRDLSVTCHATSPMVFKNDLKNFPSPSKNKTTAPASPSLPAAPSKFLVEEFTPTDSNVAMAEKHGIEAGEFDAQLDRFRGYYADHEPETSRFWEGKFSQWLVTGLGKHCDRRWTKPSKPLGKPTSEKPKAPVGASEGPIVNTGYYAVQGTQQFDAWDRYYRKTKGGRMPHVPEKTPPYREGWWVDSEYPAGPKPDIHGRTCQALAFTWNKPSTQYSKRQ